MKNLNKDAQMVVNSIIEAYVRVMGAEKWNSLSENQQHDVIMIAVRDITKRVSEM